MQEQLISFETAKLAKEKGLEQHPTKLFYPYYNYKGEFKGDVKDYLKKYLNEEDATNFENIFAPTQSLLQKWLMEKYRIFININYDGNDEVFRLEIIKQNNDRSRKVFYLKEENIIMMFHSYEDALEISLQEGLKLI